MKKESAVDWLFEQIPFEVTSNRAAFEALQIAKEMERQNIIDAFVAGDERGTGDIPFNCEQYYTQTFKD